MLLTFQSTPPAWGATRGQGGFDFDSDVSIHAPRVGGDDFVIMAGRNQKVSIHAPRVGGDIPLQRFLELIGVSIHAPRVGGDSISLLIR